MKQDCFQQLKHVVVVEEGDQHCEGGIYDTVFGCDSYQEYSPEGDALFTNGIFLLIISLDVLVSFTNINNSQFKFCLFYSLVHKSAVTVRVKLLWFSKESLDAS